MNEKKQSRWTPEFKKIYGRLYMNRCYQDNKIQARKIKNTDEIKRKYNIDKGVIDKYGSDLWHIIKLKKLVSELPAGVFAEFLNDFEGLIFDPK